MYDLYTSNYELAETILEIIGKAYLVDNTLNPHVFQFLDLKEAHLRSIKQLLEENLLIIEIREQGGRYVWPNREVFSLDQALDL